LNSADIDFDPDFFRDLTDERVGHCPTKGITSLQPYDHDKAFAGYREGIKRRVEELKREMGDRLLSSPYYRPDPRHSLRVEIYTAAGEPQRQAIAQAARQIRENNPAFIAAQAAIQFAVSNYQGA
jgi:hypothetical protein